MKVHDFEVLVTRLEGQRKRDGKTKVAVGIGQVKEIRYLINQVLKGKLNNLIKGM